MTEEWIEKPSVRNISKCLGIKISQQLLKPFSQTHGEGMRKYCRSGVVVME